MMPAPSKAMRRAAAIAEKVKSGKMAAKPGSASAEMAKSMTGMQLHEFASTPEKGLPQRVKKTPTGSLKKKGFSK